MAGGRRASGREVGEKRQETAGRGPRVTDRADLRVLFACAGSPSAPQGAGFDLDPPAPVLARAGEKQASEGMTGPFFGAGAANTSVEDLLGTRLEMLLWWVA